MSPLSPSCLRHWSVADARYVLILEARFLSGLMDELKTLSRCGLWNTFLFLSVIFNLSKRQILGTARNRASLL